ncbi:MAG: hypothetical protein E4H18_00935 [Hyphomicrobiales bacterium]|nr:MAG: hypothetical protein E4H18_00935 [Hyphomicrobiales bacterium]
MIWGPSGGSGCRPSHGCSEDTLSRKTGTIIRASVRRETRSSSGLKRGASKSLVAAHTVSLNSEGRSMSMPLCTFPRGFHLIFAKLVLGSLLLAASSGAAMAVKASAPTVTCTGQCEACIEMEQGNRCVKCGLAPECISDPGLSSDFTAMLTATNAYRARHCAPALSWSPQLAKGAQDWANACTPEPDNKDRFAHSPGAWKDANGYGENLYWGTRTTSTSAVDWWYNEIQKYDFANPVYSNDVAHFTQLVWKSSTQLGCGVALCGGRNFWVCRYSPPGNWNVKTPGVLAANVLQSCAQKKQGGSTKPQSVPVPAGPADAGQNQRGEWSAFASNERGN